MGQKSNLSKAEDWTHKTGDPVFLCGKSWISIGANGIDNSQKIKLGQILLQPKGSRASLVVQMVKNPPVMWETWVPSLGWEDPLEEGTATHSSILV